MWSGKSEEFRPGGGLLGKASFCSSYWRCDWEGTGICLWCCGAESAFACGWERDDSRVHEIRVILASPFF
jgi:hypothetical protein